MVKNYNDSFQRTVKDTPDAIRSDTADANAKTKENIKKSVLPKNQSAKELKFKVGDLVRLKRYGTSGFVKLQGQNWTKQLYQVVQVFQSRKDNIRNQCQVKEDKPDGKVFGERFFDNDLLKVEKVKDQVKQPELNFISSIVRPLMVKNGTDYIPSLEVRWKGTKGETTVEPLSQLESDVPKLVKSFVEKHKVVFTDKTVKWVKARK